MKIRDLLTPGFRGAFAKLAAVDLPIKTAWKLKHVTDSIDEQAKKYEDMRKVLLNKYAKKEKNGSLKVKSYKDGTTRYEFNDVEAFNLEHEELLEVDLDIEKIELKFTDLSGNVKLSLADVNHLAKLVDLS